MKKIFYLLAITALLSVVLISCKDKVTITDINISSSSLKLGVGGTATLSASLRPYDAKDKMKWSSSNNNVVSVEGDNSEGTVSKCVVTAKNPGTAIVTVCTKDGKHKTACTVTVINAEAELIWVEGGTFTMGCTDGECFEDGREEPNHKVTVSSFYIAKYSVTQEQWEVVMGNNPSFCVGDKHPVERINWDDAQQFIQKLNSLTGKKYRLLTEAEWEYAARGGIKSKNYKYSGSNDVNAVAWYNENSGSKSHPVGSKNPNELGIYDMSGNVWDWCSDWYDSYSISPQTNPTGPSSGSRRVVRGGNYMLSTQQVRVSIRSSWEPTSRNNYVGFRLAHP